MYKKLKKQNGEKFAQTIRNFHNGILEIPELDVILRHAGQDAEPLLPYLMSLLATNDDMPAPAPADPFVLLEQAGYKAFHADTLEKQNSIKKYFEQGELLCTFNDASRHQRYHIVHAVKKDADQIKRASFKGKEERQDAYGTSVISIQMLKKGGFISIKNRYNHAVSGCDNTFNSNPDNIIQGLSIALKDHFKVEFSAAGSVLPNEFVPIGRQIFKSHMEHNNIHYGDQAWAENGTIHAVDRSTGDALFEGFLFDNKTRTLKNIDPREKDSFANDFNRCYGGNRSLTVDRNGNLTLNGDILIGAEKSRIKTLYLPELDSMSDWCLAGAKALTHFNAPALISMDECCFHSADALIHFDAPALTSIGQSCLRNGGRALTHFNAPALISMDDHCFTNANALIHFNAPALTLMGNSCLCNIAALTHFDAPALTSIGNNCLRSAYALTHFDAPMLTSMGNYCLFDSYTLMHFDAPALTSMGTDCFYNAKTLMHFDAPPLTSMGDRCLHDAAALTHFNAPVLTAMGSNCLFNATALTHFDAPMLTSMGSNCLRSANALTHFNAPGLPWQQAERFPQQKTKPRLKR